MENVAQRAAPLAAAYEYAVASRALAGERQSGDAALVQASADRVLVAVVDGLGHGDEAAVAAQTALGSLREHAGEPLLVVLQRCHEALQQTRGAAVTLIALDALTETLRWCGVGNVEALLVGPANGPARDKRYLTNVGGVVGYRLPVTRVEVAPIHPGDLLILATDGIDSRFALEEVPPGSPEHLAQAILDRHGKAIDDALVLVLRWRGAGAASRRRS